MALGIFRLGRVTVQFGVLMVHQWPLVRSRSVLLLFLRHIQIVDIQVKILDTLFRVVMMGAHVDTNDLHFPMLAETESSNDKYVFPRAAC